MNLINSRNSPNSKNSQNPQNPQNPLNSLGWHPFFEAYFNEYAGTGLSAGRVAIENKSNYLLYTGYGELTAEISGKMFYSIDEKVDYPAVGDWVVFRPIPEEKKAIIENVLPRRSKFSRKINGSRTGEQIVASNIDVLFIMSSLNQDLNLRRIERYLTLAWESEAAPVILLSKSDLCDDIDEKRGEVESIAFGVPIHIISSINKIGLEDIQQYFDNNKTAAVLGSSGVGKSTLINTLIGYNRLKVNEITDYKDKGIHTTSRRELILLPGGGLIMDTPGMRAVIMWEGSDGVNTTFEDIEELIKNCRFTDCKHESEPGCAVNEAIEIGTLDEDRYHSYLKLKREVNYFERRHNQKAMIAEKKKWKKIHMQAKEHMKMKGK
jgi:ribosome biogenesis GTPase